MNLLIKKYKKLYSAYGLYSLIVILINHILYKFFKKTYLLDPIDHHKKYLNKKIIEISNSRIMAGDYKGVFLLDKSNWSKFDFATKLLGSYEQQIQKLIVNVQKKNNLKNFINIGAGDGYHTLGLIKNNFFNQAICYEISQQTRKILEYNLKINNIEKKVVIYKNANIEKLKKDLKKIKFKETLFLIDIEGYEFELLANEDLYFFNKAHIIIEDHNFLINNNSLKNKFYSNIKKYFNYELIDNGSRNPFNIDNQFLNELNDDSRFLLLGEGRPIKMHWIYLSPKN